VPFDLTNADCLSKISVFISHQLMILIPFMFHLLKYFNLGDSMKKNLFFLLISLFVIYTLTGCNKDISLKLHKSLYNIEVGSSTKLKLSIKPSKYRKNIKIEWTSNDSKIATVNPDGLVKAVTPGSAIITAKVKGQNNSTIAHIKVIPKYKLNQENLTIEQGSTEKLEVLTTPSNFTEKFSASWLTSDPNVITVDNSGLVKGVSEGIAIVTVNMNNGQKKLNTQVKVISKKVTGVKLNKINIVLTVGASETLQSTVFPIDAKNRNLSWVSNKTNIVQVDKVGKIRALSVGEATITVTTEDGGFTTVCTVKVNKKPTKIIENTTPKKTIKKNSENQVDNTPTQNTELKFEVKKGIIVFYPNNNERVMFQSRLSYTTQPNQFKIQVRPSHSVNGSLAPPQPYENYDFKAIFHLIDRDNTIQGKTDFKDYAAPVFGKFDREIPVDIYITYKDKNYKFNDSLILPY
jgi:uncharacterized protein YjdB